MSNSVSPSSRQRSAGSGSLLLAKPLAPEEVRTGDFVAVMATTYELPSFFWCADSFQIPHNEPVRMQFWPEDSGLPLKVRSLCLPFVFVKEPSGGHRTLDLRRHRVARLHAAYGKAVWKAYKKTQPKSATV